MYERVLRGNVRGKRVRAQWLQDDRYHDDGEMFVRARLVAMEVAWEARSDCFAGAPSLPCVRLVFSFAAALVRGTKRRLVALYDVSVAFYHALLDEEIWVEPPKSENEDPDYVWQLRKALYGTRRAALKFQEYVIDALVKHGFKRVAVAAQVFYQPQRAILVVVHGDDF